MLFFWLALTIISFVTGLFFVLELPGAIFKQRLFYKRIKSIAVIIVFCLSLAVTIIAIIFSFSGVEDATMRYPLCGVILAFGVLHILGTIRILRQIDYAKIEIASHGFKELIPYVIVTVSASFMFFDYLFVRIAILVLGNLLSSIRIVVIILKHRNEKVGKNQNTKCSVVKEDSEDIQKNENND